MNDQIKGMVETLRARRDRRLARAARACFHDELGELSHSAKILLADLAKAASIGGSSFKVDAQGRVDLAHLARIEGRREIVNRMLNLLSVDQREIHSFAEVDDGRA